MSGDEVVVFVVSAITAAVSWVRWLWQATAVARRSSGAADRAWLFGGPLAGFAVLACVLRFLAADDVKESPVYLAFYAVMGAAWVGLALRFLPIVGISPRDDVIERGNRAAGTAVAGAVIGLTLCFAGGNIGNGPGWWVVTYAAGLSTVTWFVLWGILAGRTGAAEAVTIDRDPASGLRAAGFFVATGLILGRAVAGDWVSSAATVRDFIVLGWPALLLLAGAFFLEKTFAPTPQRPAPSVVVHGWLPAAFYVGLAVFVVAEAGRPW